LASTDEQNPPDPPYFSGMLEDAFSRKPDLWA